MLMPARSLSPEGYARARRLLMRRDPVLGGLIKQIGPCGMAERQRKDHLTALIGSIVSQQLSTKAAATIFGRFVALFPGERRPGRGGHCRALRTRALRGVGLSGQKVALPARPVRPDRGRAPGSRRARCTRRRGGHRAADVSEGVRPLDGRDVPDVPPASARRAARGRPRNRQNACSGSTSCGSVRTRSLLKIGEAWRPYRSVASWYLWQSLRYLS